MSCKTKILNRCYLAEATKLPIQLKFNLDISGDTFEYAVWSIFQKDFVPIKTTPVAASDEVLIEVPQDLPIGSYLHRLTWTRAGVVRIPFSGSLQIKEHGCQSCEENSDVSFTLTDELLTVQIDLGEIIRETATVNYNTFINVNPRGEYVAGETYATGDSVSLNGSSYISKIDGNTTAPLDAEGMVTDNWQLAAQGIADSKITQLDAAIGNANTAATNANTVAAALAAAKENGDFDGKDGENATITAFTDETTFGNYAPSDNEIAVLYNA